MSREPIKIVMGVACGGKSHFIKNNFPDAVCLDVFDYQQKRKSEMRSRYEALTMANEDIKEDLVKNILEGNDVVMEHTLLRAIRREPYIAAIKEVTDRDIDIYCVYPSEEQYARNLEARDLTLFDVSGMWTVLEVPKKEEGYSHVYIVDENGIREQDQEQTKSKSVDRNKGIEDR